GAAAVRLAAGHVDRSDDAADRHRLCDPPAPGARLQLRDAEEVGGMAEITLAKLRKEFRGTVAVQEMDLAIKEGEFLVLVGPSGCGKTTTLRMIAGLEDPTSGEIAIAGRPANDLEPGHRNIGMVFQNLALFPHKTVYDNIA